MINLLEGVPGSGKSYEAVVHHLLPALRAGRKVITNLPLKLQAFGVLFPELLPLIEVRRQPCPMLGTWDPEAAGRNEQAFQVSGAPVPPVKGVPLFGGVWDFYSPWRSESGQGALFIIDECHVSFPKEKPRKGIATATEVVEWFKIHRHFGFDVLLVTQRMGSLDEEIAGLAEFHIRVRKASFLGREKEYVRKVFAGFRGGEISSEIRPYEEQFFPLYKSHTQGSNVVETSASDISPVHLKWKRAAYACMLVGVLGLVFVAYRILGPADKKPVYASVGATPLAAAAARASSNELQRPVEIIPAVHIQTLPDKGPDPLESRNLHMTGCIAKSSGERWCTFTVSQNGMPVFQITDKELEGYGFKIKYLGDCAAQIAWDGKYRAVVCDAPSVGMRVAGTR